MIECTLTLRNGCPITWCTSQKAVVRNPVQKIRLPGVVALWWRMSFTFHPNRCHTHPFIHTYSSTTNLQKFSHRRRQIRVQPTYSHLSPKRVRISRFTHIYPIHISQSPISSRLHTRPLRLFELRTQNLIPVSRPSRRANDQSHVVNYPPP